MSLIWHGAAIKRGMLDATLRGIDKTMSRAVISAKRNHPGWSNQTSAAEGSVRIVKEAQARGSGAVGLWGSAGVDYVIHLEFLHGSFLRRAADKTYPKLAGTIRGIFTQSFK